MRGFAILIALCAGLGWSELNADTLVLHIAGHHAETSVPCEGKNPGIGWRPRAWNQPGGWEIGAYKNSRCQHSAYVSYGAERDIGSGWMAGAELVAATGYSYRDRTGEIALIPRLTLHDYRNTGLAIGLVLKPQSNNSYEAVWTASVRVPL